MAIPPLSRCWPLLRGYARHLPDLPRLLEATQAGDHRAAQLLPLVHDELRTWKLSRSTPAKIPTSALFANGLGVATGTRNNKTGGSAAGSSTITLALGYLPSSCSIRSAVGGSFENPQTTLPARSIRRYVGHDSTPYRVAVSPRSIATGNDTFLAFRNS
jgi:hypothetical protein